VGVRTFEILPDKAEELRRFIAVMKHARDVTPSLENYDYIAGQIRKAELKLEGLPPTNFDL
jgi:hypothetical protein